MIQFLVENLKCSYAKRVTENVKVVLEIDRLEIPCGETVFIVGESGIGKSTILELLGLMNNTVVPSPDSRFLFYDKSGNPVDLLAMWRNNDDAELSEFRLRNFSFIFQSTNLMQNFTAYENIALTRMLQGYSEEESFARAKEVLGDLGLGHIGPDRMAQELSGGQQQRLTFARAILPDFTVLFGDEPTGNLDSENAVKAMELLSSRLEAYKGSSAIIVSHDMHLATSFADRIVLIRRNRREQPNEHGEYDYYGRIDATSVFLPAGDGRWSNGAETMETTVFEQYLRRGGQQ